MEETDIEGLRKVTVDVDWLEGRNKEHLSLTTYIADKTCPE